MNRPNITAIALDTATVLRWIQDAANCEAFVFPVDVVGIQVDEDITHLDVRPRTETPQLWPPTEPTRELVDDAKAIRAAWVITEDNKTFIRAEA